MIVCYISKKTSHVWYIWRAFLVPITEQISKRYFCFIFYFKIGLKHSQFHLVRTFLSSRQSFNNHSVDLYAQFVRICPVPLSIPRESSNVLDHWMFFTAQGIIVTSCWVGTDYSVPARLSLKSPNTVICETDISLCPFALWIFADYFLPTRCFVELWRTFWTFQGNCSVYKEVAIGETDIAQLNFYLLPEKFIITLCNVMQQKKTVKVCHLQKQLLAQVLHKVFCAIAVFLHAVVLTQEVQTVVILEANPHPASGAAQTGCKLQLYAVYMQLVYAASMISNLIPVSKFFKQQHI